MAHELSIEVPFISNTKVMRIFDTSLWDGDVSTIRLDITAPGYTESVNFIQSKGFDRLFNTVSLEITESGDIGNLPDGIYILRLNADDEWVEYNHLRQTCLLKSYYKALCSLNFYPCDTLDIDLEAKREELMVIKSYIDAAKAKVEWCGAPSEGINIHNFAKKLMDKFSLEKCKTC